MERERAKRGQNAPAQITAINLEADPVKLASDAANRIGMLVAELVTNSFKYADPVGGHGSISVHLKQNAGGRRLTVSDQGRGLPDNLDLYPSKVLCGPRARNITPERAIMCASIGRTRAVWIAEVGHGPRREALTFGRGPIDGKHR